MRNLRRFVSDRSERLDAWFFKKVRTIIRRLEEGRMTAADAAMATVFVAVGLPILAIALGFICIALWFIWSLLTH